MTDKTPEQIARDAAIVKAYETFGVIASDDAYQSVWQAAVEFAAKAERERIKIVVAKMSPYSGRALVNFGYQKALDDLSEKLKEVSDGK